MSIENNIKRIADALEIIASKMELPLSVEPVTAPAEQIVEQAVQQVIPQPAPQPVVPNCPITDNNSLVTYVMQSYQAMGAEKGAAIQTILNQLGYSNINDVKPEHYAQIYTGIEGLKNA